MSLCFPLALFPLKPHTSHTYRCHCTLTLNGKDTAVAVEHRMQRGNNEPNAKHACVSTVFLVLYGRNVLQGRREGEGEGLLLGSR